ncbi:hypothetical protein D0Z08_30210 [Nocardioides immobilis]|uniref:Uncharacterized protein n=1 Tax=Nocardioides immobilis TaxID=2049295 RepID=A0A417XSS5_9ACTN|nr:hypothetical protein [Nocardioides immobilis]RHW23366.1 hypothetical protein D0Z08_30210 [Nocardioides immobilis]
MAIKETEYPIYEPGQTLTADQLNTTTAFLLARDRLLGKLVGFGINAGLGGTVAGNKLTIAPGRAVDQAGTPLALIAAHDITLPPTPVTPSYDFINSNATGFSIVIEARDDIAPPPACGEAGCGGHPELHTPVVDVRVVRGRLTGSWMKFEQEELLGVRPILVDASANPTGWTYAKLRDAIVQRLTNGGDPLVSATLIAKLQATDMAAGDLPGVKGYKCGWLNMVLFATLDLLRCEALCALLDDKTTKRNGVVLGWLHQETAGWVFDCSYRHHWEPPRGFTEAFLGGTCSDPCALYREEVEGLLGSYAPPDPPPAGGGGTVHPPHYCKHHKLLWKDCLVVTFPPKKIDPDWKKYWVRPKDFDPRGPIWNPPIKYDPQVIYEIDPIDTLEDGFLHGGDLLGHPADEVSKVLTDSVKELGGKATIKVVKDAELSKLDGYLPSTGFSPSDVMVLTVDGAGHVIGTGRISALHTTREMGAALPRAVEAADTATTAAAGIAQTVKGFEAQVGEFDNQMKTLSGDVKSLDEQFKGITTLNERVIKLEGGFQVITRTREPGLTAGFDVDFARGIAEFAGTTVEAMRSLGQVGNRNFERYTAAAAHAQAELDLSVATGEPAALTVATLEVLDTMRTMVKAAGVDPSTGRALDAKLRGLRGMVR